MITEIKKEFKFDIENNLELKFVYKENLFE